MHIAEIRTVAKSLPLLRLNTHKSLILSYSADFSVILRKNKNSLYIHTRTYNEFFLFILGVLTHPQFKLTDEPIRQVPLDESTIPFYPNLSWLHYERLLRVKDTDARLWYLKEAAREQWDYRTLQRNISSQYYYRLLKIV